jgi:hypothetical protein
MVSMNGVQLLSPSAATTLMWGRSIMTSDISNRRSNSGRGADWRSARRLTARSEVAPPSARHRETRQASETPKRRSGLDDQVEAVTARICASTAWRRASRLSNQDVPIRPISATPKKAATGIPRRFIPWAIVNDISRSG